MILEILGYSFVQSSWNQAHRHHPDWGLCFLVSQHKKIHENPD